MPVTLKYNTNTAGQLNMYTSINASCEVPTADVLRLTASLPGDHPHRYTITITDTVSAGGETLVWTASTVVLAVEAGVTTVTQAIAAAGGVTGTAWGAFTDASGAPGSTTVAAMSATAMKNCRDIIYGILTNNVYT